ncbi:MAG: Bug family tripartite tricarboxylate transporter substrate binding protein [Burkholderiales bacterium]
MQSTFARCLPAVLTAIPALFNAPVQAQAYPSKQISIIVTLVPGTGMDIIARAYGEKLTQGLGRPVIIENKPGASQIIGVNALLAAPADGHTLLVATSGAMAINPSFFKKLPYDYQKDFTPVSLYLKSPFILVVNPKVPANTALEFIAYAKERPGKLSFSSANIGSAPQLAGEMLNMRFGLNIVNIPYKDTAQSIADIASGTVQMAFAEAGASQALIKDGRIRALAVSAQTRLSTLPDIPPLAEAANAPDFEAVSWHALFAKAGTPAPIIGRLHSEMKRVMAEADIQNRMRGIGLIPVDSPSVEGIQKYITDEEAKWGGIVRKLGLAGSQ